MEHSSFCLVRAKEGTNSNDNIVGVKVSAEPDKVIVTFKNRGVEAYSVSEMPLLSNTLIVQVIWRATVHQSVATSSEVW